MWAEELNTVLWVYRTTPHSTTVESPFRLTYGTEAVIPIELTELTWWTDTDTDFPANTKNLREELEFVDEIRNDAALRETTLKQKIVARHSKRVVKREFEVGDLVLQRNQKDSEEGKLAANWEGPYTAFWNCLGPVSMGSNQNVECTASKTSTRASSHERGMPKSSGSTTLRRQNQALMYVLSSKQWTPY